MDDRYTITINGQDIALSHNEFYSVFNQMRRISDREEIANTLSCRDVPYTDNMLDHLVDNLWDELWQDSDFSFAYDAIVTEMADNYVEDLKSQLADSRIRFAERQAIRAELKELEEEIA